MLLYGRHYIGLNITQIEFYVSSHDSEFRSSLSKSRPGPVAFLLVLSDVCRGSIACPSTFKQWNDQVRNSSGTASQYNYERSPIISAIKAAQARGPSACRIDSGGSQSQDINHRINHHSKWKQHYHRWTHHLCRCWGVLKHWLAWGRMQLPVTPRTHTHT